MAEENDQPATGGMDTVLPEHDQHAAEAAKTDANKAFKGVQEACKRRGKNVDHAENV